MTQRRTMQDFAHQMRWLVDEAYSEVSVVRVVLDNLNTHRMASLYETFPAAEARRIARRLEFHYTPKHGSWLNMAEIEFSVLSRCCLRQRLPDEDMLRRETQALGTQNPWRRPGGQTVSAEPAGNAQRSSQGGSAGHRRMGRQQVHTRLQKWSAQGTVGSRGPRAHIHPGI